MHEYVEIGRQEYLTTCYLFFYWHVYWSLAAFKYIASVVILLY